MKIIIRIFSVLLVLAILIVLVSFFLPSKVQVERSKVISTSVGNVFEQINNLKNWKNWDSWHKLDTNMTIVYSSENPVGAGSWYSWESQNNKVGKGKVTLIESMPNEKVKLELNFGNMGISMSEIKTERVENGTNVTLIFTSEVAENAPFFKQLFSKYMFAFAMDKFIGDAHEKSLDNLELLAQNLPEKPNLQYSIEESTIASMDVISIKDSCQKSELNNKISSVYLELQILAAQYGIQIVGSPFVMFYNWSENPNDMIVIEPGFQVEKNEEKIPKINNYHISEFKAFKTTHNGVYQNLKLAHDDVNKFLEFNKSEINGPVMEIYKKGPNETTDSTNFVTEIIYPIK